MPLPEFRNITIQGSAYGPLGVEFRYDLRRGYTVLVGPNNAGKSAILQAIFRFLHGDSEFGGDRIALILADREYVEPSTQPGSATLGSYNGELAGAIGATPMRHGSGVQGPARSQLGRILLHNDLYAQVGEMNQLLQRLGLPTFRQASAQEIVFEDNVGVPLQGSGLRGVFAIVAALTNPEVTALMIDEPEISLEPRLQKALRDLLIDASADKTIVVSTHSHLFLNRDEVESNQLVTREDGNTIVRTLTTRRELYDVTFELLGSSTEDLFFPRNYIVVEGASDQEIVTKVLDLLGTPSPTIKVLSGQGIDTVRDTVASIIRALVPIVVNDSPYAKRVVALIDKPTDPDSANVRKLRTDLGERLAILEEPSMEEYVPASIYQKAEREKDAELAAITSLKGKPAALRAYKRDLSIALAAVIDDDDLDSMRTVVDAARLAIELSESP